MGWSLCARNGHPLHDKKVVTEKDVVKYKFILPAYWTQEGFALGNDGCPLAVQKRLRFALLEETRIAIPGGASAFPLIA